MGVLTWPAALLLSDALGDRSPGAAALASGCIESLRQRNTKRDGSPRLYVRWRVRVRWRDGSVLRAVEVPRWLLPQLIAAGADIPHRRKYRDPADLTASDLLGGRSGGRETVRGDLAADRLGGFDDG